MQEFLPYSLRRACSLNAVRKTPHPLAAFPFFRSYGFGMEMLILCSRLLPRSSGPGVRRGGGG